MARKSLLWGDLQLRPDGKESALMRGKGPQAEGAASAKALRLDLFKVQSTRKGEGYKMRLKRKREAANTGQQAKREEFAYLKGGGEPLKGLQQMSDGIRFV